jgi:transcriptional regulator with XRE-family HTH domain
MTRDFFGRILRAERKRAGLTQDEMAAALQMHQSQYSRLERGEGRYTVLHLMRAKRKLGVDYDVLTGERKVGGRPCHTRV